MANSPIRMAAAVTISAAVICSVQPTANAQVSDALLIQDATTQTQQESVPQLKAGEKVLAQGADGQLRTIDTNDSGSSKRGQLKNKLNLQEGDTLSISEDGKTATLSDKSGNLLGTFEAPMVTVDGEVYDAVFKTDGAYLTTTLPDNSPLYAERACWQANTAKWTWRGAGALVCGATGVANVVAGGACGLAWAGAEDAMNINDRAC